MASIGYAAGLPSGKDQLEGCTEKDKLHGENNAFFVCGGVKHLEKIEELATQAAGFVSGSHPTRPSACTLETPARLFSRRGCGDTPRK